MKKSILIFTISMVLIFVNTAAATMTSENYQITTDVFSVGGGESGSSANYGIADTLGEPIIDTGSSTNYQALAGFRQAIGVGITTFSVSAGSLELGTLSSTSATTANHTMSIETTNATGMVITVSGDTLTSGSNTIDAIGATAAASSSGTEQFGIRLEASGSAPIASVAAQYGTSNYAYNSTDTISSSTGVINETTLTVYYVANISASTESGDYATTLTYTASANP